MKTRIQSSRVVSQMRREGIGLKRNIKAFKIVVKEMKSTTEIFEEYARVAHRVAIKKAKEIIGKVEIHENVGGGKFELLAIYENEQALPEVA